MKRLSLYCLFLLSVVLQAQTSTDSIVHDIKIFAPAGIDKLVKVDKVVKRETLTPRAVEETQGYRIQIYFNSGNNASKEAQEAKTKFLRAYPGISAYTIYQSPNYKVQVGDFSTNAEAVEFKSKIRRQFPESILVRATIKTKFKLKPKESEESDEPTTTKPKPKSKK